GHLKAVIDGDRNLTHKTLPKFQKAMALANKSQRDFFGALVRYNQAATVTEKCEVFEEMNRLKRANVHLSSLTDSQYRFLSHWLYPTIYVMTDLVEFRNDASWIRENILHEVKESDIEDAVASMLELKLLSQDADGKLRQVPNAIQVPDEVRAVAVLKYHRSMLSLVDSILNTSVTKKSERELNGLTMPVETEKLEEIKQRVREFRDEMNRYTSSLDKPNAVYQLNLHLIPLTKMKDER
ncbi:MAG: TIGR02147 family protein, partial [Pseudomonadota bacterium]